MFLDLNVLARAPARLIRSGVGDSLCRSTAQADWLLAHLLRDEPYREAPFALLREDEGPLFASAAGLLNGDIGAVRLLARVLVLSGFGMGLCGSSMPASQGEHLISHYADMMSGATRSTSFHGEQIGVTTLTMARLQEWMLAGAPPRLRPSSSTHDSVIAQFGPQLGKACWSEFSKKRLSQSGAEALTMRTQEKWPEIRRRIGAISRPARELESILRAVGAPVTPETLGWQPAFYREAVRRAREIRNRWTFLDLAADAGLFEETESVARA